MFFSCRRHNRVKSGSRKGKLTPLSEYPDYGVLWQAQYLLLLVNLTTLVSSLVTETVGLRFLCHHLLLIPVGPHLRGFRWTLLPLVGPPSRGLAFQIVTVFLVQI